VRRTIPMRSLVASLPVRDLLLRAKYLFVAANRGVDGPQSSSAERDWRCFGWLRNHLKVRRCDIASATLVGVLTTLRLRAILTAVLIASSRLSV
jgi:hypothetical protein